MANIRVYEERDLAGEEERVKKRMAFQERRSSLTTQLEFEKSRDTLKSFERWQREVAEHEKELTKLEKEEDQLQQGIAELEAQVVKKHADTEKFREAAAEIESEIAELKKKISAHNKDISDLRKKINSIEAKVLDKKLERHSYMKQAKISMIQLPMLAGSMDDIAEEDAPMTQMQTAASEASSAVDSSSVHTESLHTVSTADQTILFEKEARIKINYKKLDTELLNVSREIPSTLKGCLYLNLGIKRCK